MQHLVLFMKLLHCKVLITTKTLKQLHNVKYLKDIKYHLSYQILQAILETKFGTKYTRMGEMKFVEDSL